MSIDQLNYKELFTALSKAQAEFTPILKDKIAKGQAFSYLYADINDVIVMIRPILSKHGLCVIQMLQGEADKMFLSTMIGHASGQFLKFDTPLLLEKKTPQGLGSASTYTRRHGLIAALCLECEDDDGAEASLPLQHKPTAPPVLKKTPQVISRAQQTRLFAIGKDVPDIEIKAMIAFEGFESSSDITTERYDHICRKIEERREVLERSSKDTK